MSGRVLRGIAVAAVGLAVVVAVGVGALQAPGHLSRGSDRRGDTEMPVRPPPEDGQRTAGERAAVTFVAEMLKAGEASWARGMVRYTQSVNVRTRIDGRSEVVDQRTGFIWASDGVRCRFDTIARRSDATYLTSYVWNGREGRSYRRTQAAQRTVPIAIELSGRDQASPYRLHFPEAALACLGGEWLSAVVMRHGISAKHVGGAWDVVFAMPSGGPRQGYCVARVRPDKGYRVDSLVRFVRPGVAYSDAQVTRWTRGPGSLWVPGQIRHRLSGQTVGTITYEVRSARLVVPPSRLFTLQDDSRAPMYDLRTNRVLREGARRVVPLTESRLEATARYINALAMRHWKAEGQGTTVLHDNGARSANGACGLECVWLLARLQTQAQRLVSMRRAYPVQGGTHSLLDLDKAARARGLRTVGLQVPPSRVREVRQPFILHLSDLGHFCLVLRIDDRYVYVYNPPGRVDRVEAARFMRVYGAGHLLALRGRANESGYEGQ